MSATLINLIIQIVAGALGRNAAGAASKDVSLGTAGNTIAGAIGGGVGGQILTAVCTENLIHVDEVAESPKLAQ